MSRCHDAEQGLEYFSFNVQKHIAHLAAYSGTLVGSRRADKDTHISETRLSGSTYQTLHIWPRDSPMKIKTK